MDGSTTAIGKGTTMRAGTGASDGPTALRAQAGLTRRASAAALFEATVEDFSAIGSLGNARCCRRATRRALRHEDHLASSAATYVFRKARSVGIPDAATRTGNRIAARTIKRTT